ncbi:hypothetical protein N9850_12700 [Granulosicoccus sp.]|nr:hypothetical protein [Granulosicoccus sp.]MDB4224624.1 hypothetical protein [Granulosicoccus sp.]
MFTEFVRPEKSTEYEQWSRQVHSEAKQFKGFLSVDVIRPGAGDTMAYTTLVKFDSLAPRTNADEIIRSGSLTA